MQKAAKNRRNRCQSQCLIGQNSPRTRNTRPVIFRFLSLSLSLSLAFTCLLVSFACRLVSCTNVIEQPFGDLPPTSARLVHSPECTHFVLNLCLSFFSSLPSSPLFLPSSLPSLPASFLPLVRFFYSLTSLSCSSTVRILRCFPFRSSFASNLIRANRDLL
jgi:hypothetical protein